MVGELKLAPEAFWQMTFAEWGAAYAFLLPAENDEFTPFDEEELTVFEEIRARKLSGAMDGRNEPRRTTN